MLCCLVLVVLTSCPSRNLLGCLPRLVDDAHHRLLQCLALKIQTILVPDEVGRFDVEIVALHAALEQRRDIAIVRVGREG